MIVTLPIFPLPGILLFPGTLLPLHIFEPRYRLMMGYCQENDDEIGITAITNNSVIETVFGWGKIISRESLSDGRSNIIVQGMGIAKIARFKTHEPFIIANVEIKGNSYSYLVTDEFKIILEEIIRLTKKHLLALEADDSFIIDLEKLRTHPFPIDIITSFLQLDFHFKQDILATEDVFEKSIKLLNCLKNLVKEQY
jgi:ATP-dependent Lon protease